MSIETILQLFFGVLLVYVGAQAIIHEKELARFERSLFKRIKNGIKAFRQPGIVVVPKESEASKRARFESGKAAGDELYAEQENIQDGRTNNAKM